MRSFFFVVIVALAVLLATVNASYIPKPDPETPPTEPETPPTEPDTPEPEPPVEPEDPVDPVDPEPSTTAAGGGSNFKGAINSKTFNNNNVRQKRPRVAPMDDQQ